MSKKNLQLEIIFQQNVSDFFSLKKYVCSQIEYYFSDANIIYDTHMQKLVSKNSQGYVSLKEFLKFNKIKKVLKQFTNYFNFKLKILQVSLQDSEMLELSDNKKKIKRKIPWSQNLSSLEKQKQIKRSKTIYVENIGKQLTQQETYKIFKNFGKILTIDFPKIQSIKQQGWCFIEFQTKQEALYVIENFNQMRIQNLLHQKSRQVSRVITYDQWRVQKNFLLEFMKSRNLKQNQLQNSTKRVLIEIDRQFLGITKNQIKINLMQCGIAQFKLDLFSSSHLLLEKISEDNLELLKAFINQKKEIVNWIKSLKIMSNEDLQEYNHHKRFHQETVAKKKQIQYIKQNLTSS